MPCPTGEAAGRPPRLHSVFGRLTPSPTGASTPEDYVHPLVFYCLVRCALLTSAPRRALPLTQRRTAGRMDPPPPPCLAFLPCVSLLSNWPVLPSLCSRFGRVLAKMAQPASIAPCCLCCPAFETDAPHQTAAPLTSFVWPFRSPLQPTPRATPAQKCFPKLLSESVARIHAHTKHTQTPNHPSTRHPNASTHAALALPCTYFATAPTTSSYLSHRKASCCCKVAGVTVHRELRWVL